MNSFQFYPMDFIPLLGNRQTRDEQQIKLPTKQATIFQIEVVEMTEMQTALRLILLFLFFRKCHGHNILEELK